MLQRLLALLCLFLVLPLLGFSQEAKITGRIVDDASKEPIPFASIGLKEEQTGALTNEYGFFQMAMPQKNPQDSLVVVALGYRRKSVLIKPGQKVQDMIIEVNKLAVKLENVNVVSSAKIKNLGLGSRSNTPGEGMIQGMPGSQYAFFVKNEKGKTLGNVRTVSFYIGENGFPREPFRVRLYKADGNYNSPNTDLLTENIVVSAPKGGEWYTIDLTEYNIEAPKEGFFVAMEWIVSGDNFYTVNFMDNYTPYGQILKPTFEYKEALTWNYTMGRGWSLITLANDGKRYNAMIRAEVDQIK